MATTWIGRGLAAAGLALAVGLAPAAWSWVYPEHRDIALEAVALLDADRAQRLDELWEAARVGNESRLCDAAADSGQGLTPECIDWAALPAIAGDHSCSSDELLLVATDTSWILAVADVAAQLKADLARIPVLGPADPGRSGELVADAREYFQVEVARAARVNALRVADTRLQRADVDYATRAGANNAHFLLARARSDQTGDEYARQTLSQGSEVNAIGVYSWFHLSALQKASRLAREDLAPAARAALARAVLFDEAFALHFLEDVYASGHVAGTWGDASQRKGTHDFYNQNGLETFTWSGRSRSVVLMGDAHMRKEDLALAARAARLSLEQVLDAAAGQAARPVPHRPQAPATPDPFDVCRAAAFPARDSGMTADGAYGDVFAEVLLPTPVPGLGAGLGAMPRFRSELGGFIGLAGSIDGRTIDRGFEASQSKGGAVGGLDLSVRMGIGLEGALGEASDGLVFTSLGFRSDAPSTNRFSDSAFGALDGHLSAAVPARSGLAARLRMPFYLLPGDLLLLSPMYFVNRDTYTRMAVTASNGGLIPWQQGIATPFGRLQFVLGRELGVTFYGLDGKDQLIAPGVSEGETARVVEYKSTAFELPIIEFRPYRSFSTNQSSSVMLQLYGGADVPRGASVVIPEGAAPVDLKTIWFLGVRLTFDWRYYF